ncbi:MAG: hypothetical protein HY289_14275 [Planctomycetes bacterium]|nr:hypothetical protein [Planctomycetota bacterium]
MKRKILLGLFSLCALAMFANDSHAFGLLSPYHPSSLWNRHNRYVTQITCRPYNAFTPICWGNLVCDGCVPSPCGVASGCMPMTMGVPPWAQPACGPFMGGGFAPQPDFSRVTDMPPVHSMPPAFIPPIPMQVPSGPNSTMAYPYGVSQANYYPMYMPQYYQAPMYYNPYQAWQPNPYYWYGNGR